MDDLGGADYRQGEVCGCAARTWAFEVSEISEEEEKKAEVGGGFIGPSYYARKLGATLQ